MEVKLRIIPINLFSNLVISSTLCFRDTGQLICLLYMKYTYHKINYIEKTKFNVHKMYYSSKFEWNCNQTNYSRTQLHLNSNFDKLLLIKLESLCSWNSISYIILPHLIKLQRDFFKIIMGCRKLTHTSRITIIHYSWGLH